MSVNLMREVWDADLRPTPRKLTLLALADYGDDSGGRIFPSLADVAGKVGVSRGQVQRVVRSLIDDGLLIVVANANGGRPGQTPHYRICLDQLAVLERAPFRQNSRTGTGGADATPTDGADATPPMAQTGGVDAVDGWRAGRGGVAPVPQRDGAGATLTTIGTIKEPPANHQKTRASKSRQLSEEFADILEGVDQQVLNDWQQLRKKKGAPITRTALEDIRREAGKAGMTLNEVFTMCCSRGWQGFMASWQTPAESTGAQRQPRRESVAERREKTRAGLSGDQSTGSVIVDVDAFWTDGFRNEPRVTDE